jgi:hypothetical protein
MSYGTDLLDMYRQIGVHAGRILKGANPTDLPLRHHHVRAHALDQISAGLVAWSWHSMT